MIFVVGGSGGGFSTKDAIIHANAPVGSTITFSKDNVAAKVIEPSKAIANSDGETADYYYSVKSSNYGSWTITATSGENVRTETITVNEVKQYDCILGYDLYLYKNGNKCINASGDYVFRFGNYNGYVGYVTWDSDRVSITSTGNGVGLYTNNAIDFAPYTVLCVDWSKTGSAPVFGACDSNSGVQVSGNTPQVSVSKSTDARETTRIDITSLNHSYYVGFSDYPGGTVTVYNIWLEM